MNPNASQPLSPLQPKADNRWFTFLVADRCFAVDVSLVSEVLRNAALSRVPLAAPALAGLLNLRGRIVPVIDLRIRFGFSTYDRDKPRTNVVVEYCNEWYSLLVDDLLDVVTLEPHEMGTPSSERGNPKIDAVSGVLAAADSLIHFLDLERVFQPLLTSKTRGLAVG